ncbi:MAG: hypothetical protein IPJ19_02450 [Planctomycetes bacterium]|nr:hypothetical protein [Planctomycetota bacterium]
MSQQDNPQDSQDNFPASESGSWTPTPATNRPAEGATRVASLQQAEQIWRAGEGATDFLGLEQDGTPETPAAAQPSAEGAPADANPTQAWLFHMENESRAAAGQTAAPRAKPAAAPAPSDWSAESLVEGQDTSVATEPDAFADAPLAGAQGELVGAVAGDGLVDEALSDGRGTKFSGAETKPKRRTQWLVAAGLTAVLLGAGGWQIWSSGSQGGGSTTVDPIAWRGKPKPKPTPGPVEHKPSETPGEAPSETPSVAQTPPQETPTEPIASATTPSEAPIEPTPVESTPLVAESGTAPTPAPADPESTPVFQAPLDFTPIAFSGASASEKGPPLATPRGARRPEAAEIAGMWMQRSIPFDAITGESELRTPSVGAVRVLLKNGEHLQGRLHSVGQGHVSMDIALGRMSVEYSEVSDIVQILEADLSKKPSKGLPDETAGLMYVSVKVPGGHLTGWLVQRTEGKLTLITEEAKKITVDDDGFEPVSRGKARVVGTIGRGTTEAVTPTPPASTETPKLKSGPSKTPSKPAASRPAPPKPRGAKPKN